MNTIKTTWQVESSVVGYAFGLSLVKIYKIEDGKRKFVAKFKSEEDAMNYVKWRMNT